MANSDPSANDARASVISMFVGLAALTVTVTSLVRVEPSEPLRPNALADDLAATVQAQWLEETKARKLRDPGVLPLSWAATERDVSDDFELITGQQVGRVVKLRLEGRLEGEFDTVTRRLATDYRAIHSGRLLVLGEPGSGKTVLAVLLTLGLLDSEVRADGGPVPVLLTASSWDPVADSMDAWIVHSLATSYYNGRREIPQLLYDRGLLLPILDGLDEIPESARRSAVRSINQAIGQDRAVVVTCRSAEYQDVIDGGGQPLRRAPVIEVAAVTSTEIIAYLEAVDWPDGTDWRRVYDHLRATPDSPLAMALSTPLMVSMARRVYQRLGGSPAELLDPVRFDSRHAVEDYLLDRVIDAAYAPDKLPSGQIVPGSVSKWPAAKARGWLTFLAKYLHQHRERDLAWWLLSRRLLSPWAAPLIGLAIGAILMIAAFLWTFFLGPQDFVEVAGVSGTPAIGARDVRTDFFDALAVGTGTGAGFAILAMMTWSAGADRAPGRLSLRLRGSMDRLLRGFTTGLAVTAMVVLPVLGAAAISISSEGWALTDLPEYWALALMGGALAVTVGLAMAVHNWLDAPPRRSAQASPLRFIRQDRRSSLVGALAAGTVLGIGMLPALIAGKVVAAMTQTAVTRWPRDGWFQGVGGLGDTIAVHSAMLFGDESLPVLLGWVVLLPGTVFALLILLTRAWPRFLLARHMLAGRGLLPWRLMAFLSDAREQELLRESGGTYQFRHIRLQEWLATQQPESPGTPKRNVFQAVKHRGVVLTAIVAVLVAVVARSTIGSLPDDRSQATLIGHVGEVNAVAVGELGGKTVAVTGGDDGTRVWDLTTGEPARRPLIGHKDMVYRVALGELSGKSVAVTESDDGARVWDLTTGQPLGRPLINHDDLVWAVAVGKDGRTVAVTDNGYGTVWDLATGELVRQPLTGHTSAVYLGAVGELDGRTVAVTSSPDGVVWVRDLVTGEPVRQPLTGGRTDAVNGVAVNAVAMGELNERTVAVSGRSDGAVWVWDLAKGEPVGEPLEGHLGAVNAVAMGELNGRTVAVTGGDDGTVRVWDLAKGEPVGKPLEGHLGAVNGVAMGKLNGKAIAVTGGDDGMVRVWDLSAL